MDTEFTLHVHRQKLIKNIHFEMIVRQEEIILKRLDEQKTLKFLIELELKIDWKLKSNEIVAVGLVTDQHHWYYGESFKLQNLKKLLGGRVIYKGISDFYKPQQQIGQGSFSNVYLLQNVKDTSKYYACKCIDKQQLESIKEKIGLYEEIKIMNKLKNKNLAELFEVFEGDVSYYMVMEYLDIELVDYLKSQIDPKDIKIILQQLLEVVQFIHSQGYMHRDLKPENVLFNRTILNLKVIDFGLATKPPASNKCGTPGYVAPEVLMQNSYGITYDEKVDIFSIGVIFYKMLTGNDLFIGSNADEILQLNQKCNFNLNMLAANPKISRTALHLLEKLLSIDPKNRFTAEQALAHKYFDTITNLEINFQLEKQDSYGKSPNAKLFRQLSPLQKRQSALQSNSFIFDFELDINEEPIAKQPIQQVTKSIKHASQENQQNLENENKEPFQRRRSQDLTKLYQANLNDKPQAVVRQERKKTYRAPLPKQLQEIYKT